MFSGILKKKLKIGHSGVPIINICIKYTCTTMSCGHTFMVRNWKCPFTDAKETTEQEFTSELTRIGNLRGRQITDVIEFRIYESACDPDDSNWELIVKTRPFIDAGSGTEFYYIYSEGSILGWLKVRNGSSTEMVRFEFDSYDPNKINFSCMPSCRKRITRALRTLPTTVGAFFNSKTRCYL